MRRFMLYRTSSRLEVERRIYCKVFELTDVADETEVQNAAIIAESVK